MRWVFENDTSPYPELKRGLPFVARGTADLPPSPRGCQNSGECNDTVCLPPQNLGKLARVKDRVQTVDGGLQRLA